MDLGRTWKFRQNVTFRLSALVALLVFASSAWAQSAADIAFIELVRVKADHEEQFEATCSWGRSKTPVLKGAWPTGKWMAAAAVWHEQFLG